MFAVICRNKGPGKYGKLIVTAETQKGRKGDKVLTLQFTPPCVLAFGISPCMQSLVFMTIRIFYIHVKEQKTCE